MAKTRKNEFGTDAELRAIEKAAVNHPRREWRDKETRGLVFVTQPSGSCAWYLFYKPRAGATARKLRLGDYSREFGLKKARAVAVAKRAQIDQGLDPVQFERDAKVKALGLTFQELAERYLLDCEKIAESTRTTYRHALPDAFAVFGNKVASEVTRENVIEVCKRIEKRFRIDPKTGEKYKPTSQADHTRLVVSSVYTWGIDQGLVTANPARDIKRRGVKLARTRTPSDAELAALWQSADMSSGAISRIVKLAILTGQRRTEVAGARVSELHDLDYARPVWIIPGDVRLRGRIVKGRTKNGIEQHVHLSRQAAVLFSEAIRDAAPLNGAKSEYVFPADHTRLRKGKKPRKPHINGESVSRAVRRLREIAKKAMGSASIVDEITIHDMRRAISNHLKNAGISREIRDLILNHKDQSVTELHYSQSARMETQVREAFQLWADHVEQLASSAQSSAGDEAMALAAE